jgi:ABC-type bacteriocin/lantibiotic exporter with double-glycine peptidase domain
LLINWNVDEDEDYSHYSILISIDKNSVWMLDPAEKKSLSEYSSDYFLPCWKSADYWFCVIEEKDKENRNPEQIADEETNVKSIDEVNWEISDTLEETFSLLDTTGTDGK